MAVCASNPLHAVPTAAHDAVAGAYSGHGSGKPPRDIGVGFGRAGMEVGRADADGGEGEAYVAGRDVREHAAALVGMGVRLLACDRARVRARARVWAHACVSE